MAKGGAKNDDPLMVDHITEEIAEMGSDFLTRATSNESPSVAVALKDDVLGFLQDLDKAKDFLSCINCKQGFDTTRQRPVLLPCLMAICKQCELDFLASHTTAIECSYCKCLHACVENDSTIFPRDNIRESMLAIFRLINGESDLRCEMCTGSQEASHRCFDCSLFICDECTKLHSSLRALVGHSYKEIKSLSIRDMESLKMFSSTLYCSTPGHEQKIVELFCSSESCKRLVCLLCAVNAHKTHNLCDVSQVVNEKNIALRELKNSLNARNEQSFISLRVIKEKKDACSIESAQLEKEIRMCFSKAKMILEKREKELCDDLKQKQKERKFVLDLEKTRLNNLVDSCTKACQYVDAANALHCHSAFLNVSTYMESRLQSLESVSPNINSSSFEKMKFNQKELESSIVNARYFGKILTTKASFSMSEATACPLICDVGVEITFTVKLKTSSGRVINDEEVYVHICHNGKLLKVIPCILGKCNSFIGTWIPDKPMKTTWQILSNGIELNLPREEFLQVVDNCSREKDASFVLCCDSVERVNHQTEKTYIMQGLSAEETTCCICMDTPSNPTPLKCGHIFCAECIEQQFKYKPACPICGQLFGKLTGDQPLGTVSLRKEWRRLPGYEDCNESIVITYSIRGGPQGEEHPNPNQYFKGITRSGYIPNNRKGRLVAKLLNIAFTRRLVFTIGRSRTTGEEGVVTWNDIRHKIRPEGGPQRFGYPDDTYLDRVLEDLAVKGVTPESADDPEEYREYSRCFF